MASSKRSKKPRVHCDSKGRKHALRNSKDKQKGQYLKGRCSKRGKSSKRSHKSRK